MSGKVSDPALERALHALARAVATVIWQQEIESAGGARDPNSEGERDGAKPSRAKEKQKAQ